MRTDLPLDRILLAFWRVVARHWASQCNCRCCISAGINSIIICTGGHPVVLEMSFSQPITAVQFISSSVSVRSESNRAQNISFRCVDKEMDLTFVRSHEEVDCERQVVESLACMHDQEDSLADKPNPKFFVVPPRFERLWFIDCREYSAGDCNFDMPMHRNGWLTRTFFWVAQCAGVRVSTS